MALTNDERKTRALAVIKNGKRTGRLDSKKMTDALQTLSDLSPGYYAHGETERRENWHAETSHRPVHHAPDLNGFTVNGELVAIAFPPAAETHDRALGWEEPSTPESRARAEHDAKFATAGGLLADVVRWLVGSSPSLETIGLRGIALAATLQPHLFDDCTGSQAAIARRFGLTRSALQQRCNELRDLTNGVFQGRNMRNQEHRQAARLRAIQQHKRAGHTMHA